MPFCSFKCVKECDHGRSKPKEEQYRKEAMQCTKPKKNINIKSDNFCLPTP